MNVAPLACSLCINRRLYKIATTKAVMVTPTEKRRAVITDLLIGIGIPLLQIVSRTCSYSSSPARWLRGYLIEYVVSGHRFNLLEDFGPFPATVAMYPSIPMVFLWPLLIGIVSLYYCSEYLVLRFSVSCRGSPSDSFDRLSFLPTASSVQPIYVFEPWPQSKSLRSPNVPCHGRGMRDYPVIVLDSCQKHSDWPRSVGELGRHPLGLRSNHPVAEHHLENQRHDAYCLRVLQLVDRRVCLCLLRFRR